MEEAATKKDEKQIAAAEAADAFAKKGKAVVRDGMELVLGRLRFAKKQDAMIQEAICRIEDAQDISASQKKGLVDTLKRAAVLDTEKVLYLVTNVLERLEDNDLPSGKTEKPPENEVVVTLDERVEEWAQ